MRRNEQTASMETECYAGPLSAIDLKCAYNFVGLKQAARLWIDELLVAQPQLDTVIIVTTACSSHHFTSPWEQFECVYKPTIFGR
jgi:hypothetical protein